VVKRHAQYSSGTGAFSNEVDTASLENTMSGQLRAMMHRASSTFRKIKMTAFPTPIIKTS
jgi:hypothetical protein